MKNTDLIPEIANDMTPRKVRDSQTETHAIVHPDNTNALHNAFGGYLMGLMDVAACVVAFNHAGRKVNTISIDGVRFFRPATLGTILNIHASLNRAFNTSMEIGLKITETDPVNKCELPIAHGYFTFVAIGEDGRPTAVAPVEPETEEEKRRYEQALVRREARIALGKKLG
ncbi:acyl-CoA thioesterase [Fibrobacter sp. UWP2]|uniref:acyl-CoA thioesterase n=1 Tax=Fibrobacter sp. UWP2 TaxID=1896216 RepID=UPI00091351F2|nr:acyl-CoA thioesterase [Fibrobacter sp. UWP2]SHJ00075.1 Acyl-CoA hydrolase [Fibrobacter sp. UWP2]